jgi:hypothetical protein
MFMTALLGTPDSSEGPISNINGVLLGIAMCPRCYWCEAPVVGVRDCTVVGGGATLLTIRTNTALADASRVESVSGGEVLGAALITWLKETVETVEVVRKVV